MSLTSPPACTGSSNAEALGALCLSGLALLNKPRSRSLNPVRARLAEEAGPDAMSKPASCEEPSIRPILVPNY